MTFKPWLLAAAVYSGVATAQSPTMEQRTEAFAEVSAAMTSGNQTGAADALIAVIEDPNWAMFEGEAHARLAVQLNKLDLPYAALLAYAKAMAADPEGVGSEAGKAVDLADKVGDQAVLEPVFAKNLGLDVDDLACFLHRHQPWLDEALVGGDVERLDAREHFPVEIFVGPNAVGLHQLSSGFIVAFGFDALDLSKKLAEELP